MEPTTTPGGSEPARQPQRLNRFVSALSLLLLACMTCAGGLWYMQGGADNLGASTREFVETYSNPANVLLWIGGSDETMESMKRKRKKRDEQMMEAMRHQLQSQQRQMQRQMEDVSRQLQSINRRPSIPGRRR